MNGSPLLFCPDCRGGPYVTNDGKVPEHTEGLCPARGTWEPAVEGKPLELHTPLRRPDDRYNCEGSGKLPAAIRTRKVDGTYEPDIHPHICGVFECGWWAHEGEKCRSKSDGFYLQKQCAKHEDWVRGSSGRYKPPESKSE